MTLVILCIVSWIFFKAFTDAIVFAKGGEDCFEVWHIADAIGRLLVPLYAIYKLGLYKNPLLMIFFFTSLLGFNLMYRIFRVLNVYKIDNKLRIKWLGKILGRGGII